MDKEQLQQIYLREGYYWGKEPNRLAKMLLNFISQDEAAGQKLLDLGAGEGRDSVYFAKQGFDVTSVDISPAGLKKAEALANEAKVAICTIEADLNELMPQETVSVIYSIGALQYIKPVNRSQQFSRFKEATLSNGLHVLFAFIEHPKVDLAPDWGQNEYLFKPNELQTYYSDWNILHTEDYIFSCNSSGIPHEHAATIVIARKPSESPSKY